jgi:hypothetical protein
VQNFGTFNVTATGDADMCDIVTNTGSFTNAGMLTNRSVINNYEPGVIENSGTLINQIEINNLQAATLNTSGTLDNQGTISKFCGSTLTGVITGNPVKGNCVTTSSFQRLGDKVDCEALGGEFDSGSRVCTIYDLTVADFTTLWAAGTSHNMLRILGKVDVFGKFVLYDDTVIGSDGELNIMTSTSADFDGLWVRDDTVLENRGVINNHQTIFLDDGRVRSIGRIKAVSPETQSK